MRQTHHTTTPARTVLITPQQIAVEYGMPRTSVMRLVYAGTLPTLEAPGMRRVWIRRADYERVMGLDRPAA